MSAGTSNIMTLIAVVSAWIGTVGCSAGALPDEVTFQALVVESVANGARLSGVLVDGDDNPKIVVLDRVDPSPFQKEVKARLAELNLRWIEADVDESAVDFPGKWDTLKYSGRPLNRTHVVLRADVTGDGAVRTLQWAYHCGPRCGYGETIEFKWSNERWNTVSTAQIRY